MKSPYRPDKTPEPSKIRFKTDPEKMKSEMLKEALNAINRMSRVYIFQITDKFLERFNKNDRFQLAAKTDIINTMPPKYNELFLKRINRLCSMAESSGYTVNFSKWRTTKEYGWFFVRSKK